MMKKPTNKDLRIFLAIWALIFSAFLAFGYIKSGVIREWALICIGISIFLMIIPPFALPFYKIWLKFGDIMGFIISRSILAIIFFCIFTPLSLFFKLIKRDVFGLNLAFKHKTQSFFKERENQPSSMKNQF